MHRARLPAAARLLLTLGLFGLGAPAALAGPVVATISVTPVNWTEDGVKYEGRFFLDTGRLATAEARVPAVMVVHQWMGPGENEEMRARMLAELGYGAFVADVYGADTRPKDTKAAGEAAGRFKSDRALFRKRLLANYRKMLSLDNVDPERTAAIGYCFGGTGVLELARTGADLKGVVSFHGGLDSTNREDGKRIKAKVVMFQGADDPYVPRKDIDALLAELDAGKVTWELTRYSGAVHAFTQKGAGDDPSKGVAYDARADRRSWSSMKDFLEEILGR
ncbi:MAG: dienelactone hydrolase family protein [Deltaproteobacteria bacterium]|nr:dienelactone hydrolase family protein [Deltaproteobacteria bacterium]MCB9786190.1 dienelactone hydrolase family protein [Deltaproteobacteria bacterium]